MSVEAMIKLNKYQPREYQIPLIDAIANKGYKKVLAILPRRAGKDITAFNFCIRECIKKPQTVYYIFPTYSQAKKVIWDAITSEGRRFLDFIPEYYIESMNASEMKIRFINGSLLQFLGSDNYDSLMGTNPHGIVFSEFALQDPRAYQYLSPALKYNNGWAMLLSTPRGKNHMWDLYEIANANPQEWFVYKLSINDTQHIPLYEIEKERAEGILSDDLIAQEYYCSFSMGVEGAYYSRYMDKARLEGRIGFVPYIPGKTYTAWDLGIKDPTAIIMFQIFGASIHIIDCYEKSDASLVDHAKMLLNRDYLWDKHFGPHDLEVREQATGFSRKHMLHELGVKIQTLPMIPIDDGIEAVRANFSRLRIDEVKCQALIKALENYGEEWCNKRKVYLGKPKHSKFSHLADAMRYLCTALKFATPSTGMSGTEMVEKYGGNNPGLPRQFQTIEEEYGGFPP